jgi:hypothetical protein
VGWFVIVSWPVALAVLLTVDRPAHRRDAAPHLAGHTVSEQAARQARRVGLRQDREAHQWRTARNGSRRNEIEK